MLQSISNAGLLLTCLFLRPLPSFIDGSQSFQILDGRIKSDVVSGQGLSFDHSFHQSTIKAVRKDFSKLYIHRGAASFLQDHSDGMALIHKEAKAFLRESRDRDRDIQIELRFRL